MGQPKWDVYGVCECGFKEQAAFGKLHHIHLKVCPECGSDKDTWGLKTMKYISEFKLFDPSTWGAGHWETLEEQDETSQ